ncbi:melanoregulin [Cynoglossus semilaevis]|uniref:melanoregulin n=1 Tax=Cynoglossus semilaevis TaxID=244447 RepID=UPI0004983BAA|nr:melanoregulin-like [Cynoglossus semilaevis]
MGAQFTLCCCHFLKYSSEENAAIMRVNRTSGSRPLQLLPSVSSDSDTEEQRQSQKNGSGPLRVGDARRESDRELQAFISMRDKTDKATEEWEKLNFDIHTLRYAKREVRSRWKKILEQLGYQNEVDVLLLLNKQRRFSRDQEHFKKATELLTHLLNHTSLFPPGTGPQNRYLSTMDYLVSLDSGEDFVRLAKEKYPKK